MWKLDHKEGQTVKIGYFWTVMLEKTPVSPLDSKEVKPVNPKGNQSWIFLGRTDADPEAPVLWPPDVKSQFIGKDADAGKIEGRRRRGNRGWDDWMVSLTQLSWVWANFRRWWRTGKPACCSPWDHKVFDMTERPNNDNKQNEGYRQHDHGIRCRKCFWQIETTSWLKLVNILATEERYAYVSWTDGEWQKWQLPVMG